MAVEPKYRADVETILSHQNDQGWELWTTPDKRIIKGAPFSAAECASYLLELGLEPTDPVMTALADLFFAAWQPDGRFKVYPKGSIFPCQTVWVAEVLARMGYAEDERLQTTFRHLLAIQQPDGGLRCEKYYFGRGPETEHSNPLPTLTMLAALRHSEAFYHNPALDRAADFLLGHWETRAPIGPCHYGIGSLFMQVEYPRYGYNLLDYVHVLSFYPHARQDKRFHEALAALTAKLMGGQLVVERQVPKLRALEFCKKGAPCALATRRYKEILRNTEVEGK